jgi:hypothetical protein
MWFWIVMAFGFLFSLRAVRAGAGEKRTGLSQGALWHDAADLAVSLLFLVVLYDLGAAWEKAAAWLPDFGFLGLWGGAYLIGRYQKKPDIFFVSLAVFAYAIVTAFLRTEIHIALALPLGIFIFQVFFKGLKYALLFSRVPEPVKGWPILCLTAFCITVILSGALALFF